MISGYPFRDEAIIEITAGGRWKWSLLVRIPGFAQGALVDGEKAESGLYRIYRKWEGEFRVKVSFFLCTCPYRPAERYESPGERPAGFSSPIAETCRKLEYVKDGVERKGSTAIMELTPASDWNSRLLHGNV